MKTHQRSSVIVPEMVGAIVGVYNGKQFSNVEIKFDMIGRFAMKYYILDIWVNSLSHTNPPDMESPVLVPLKDHHTQIEI